jgi:flagellar biosynthetic protein FliR
MLEEITVLYLFHFMLIFTRMGTAMMIFPGIGEVYVTPRARLVLAVSISLVVFPTVTPYLPPVPGGVIGVFLALIPEAIIGLVMGSLTRVVQAVLHMAGMIIAFQSSLASALLFDANQGSQGSVIGNFMTLVGVTLLFVTNMHHLMITGVVESYQVFGGDFSILAGDFAEMMTMTLSKGFLIAVKISSPLIVIGLLVYLGSGILGRLMPQMQVFMVMVPGQIYIAFTFFVLTFSAGMMWYLRYFEEVMSMFLVE